MLLGKKLPGIPDKYKTEESKLHGCESNVWLHHHYDEQTMQLYFTGDSDARVIRRLVAIVLSLFNGKRPQDISRFNVEEVQSLAHRFE